MTRLTLLTIGAGLLLAAPQRTVFRSAVELVRVDVSVMRGRTPVTGLGVDDFELFDNGVRQRVDAVQYEQVPLDAWLVLDMSQSVAGPKLDDLRAGARGFLQGLSLVDRAALVTFSHHVSLVHPLTEDVPSVNLALGDLYGDGSTSLRDALFAALQAREPDLRRAVMVAFSDGVDTMSWISHEDVLYAARRSDVIIYGVVTVAPRANASDNLLLRDATRATGGRLWEAESGKLGEAFSEVLRDIRTRYLLTYYPESVGTGGWHTLKVTLKGTRGEVRARPGYYAPGPGG